MKSCNEKYVMMNPTKYDKANSESLIKAKSANKTLTTTKPCVHESTLDGGNAKPPMAGTLNL